jgi:peptidoglycan/xylan/chitin deacetylase (PgdA/CDA1 family)
MNLCAARSSLAIIFLLSACTPLRSTQVTIEGTDHLDFQYTLVSLTFDDGDVDNYAIRSVLAENDLKATFYIISGFIGTDGYMNASQLRDLAGDGNEIGGHSLSHVDVTGLEGSELRQEICQNRLDLLALGLAPVSFAYPFGHFNEGARQTVMDCGYNSARTVIDGPDTIPPGDPFLIKSMPYIVKDTRLPKMQRYITEAVAGGGGWVIYVFHHICSGCDQYAIEPGIFKEFASWLGLQQKNGLIVKTIGEVIGDELKPGVEP